MGLCSRSPLPAFQILRFYQRGRLSIEQSCYFAASIDGSSENHTSDGILGHFAVVEGISLAEPLQPEQQAAINNALLQHQVLLFRDQPITPQQQHAFAKQFGDLHVHPLYPNFGPEIEEIMILDADGQHPPDNDHWHTDVTFIQTPPKASILSAQLVPPVGGDTLFASGIAAFDALSTPLQAFLVGLKAKHSFMKQFTAPRYHEGKRGDPVALYNAAVKEPPPSRGAPTGPHPPGERQEGAVRRRYIFLEIEWGGVSEFMVFTGEFVMFIIALFCEFVCFFITIDVDVGSYFVEYGGLCAILQYVGYSNESVLIGMVIVESRVCQFCL